MSLFIHLLVWFAVALTLLCCVALLIMRTPVERLHYMAPVSTFAVLAVTIAIACETRFNQAAVKSLLILVIISITNSVLAHATARAFRIRNSGSWQPEAGEHMNDLTREE